MTEEEKVVFYGEVRNHLDRVVKAMQALTNLFVGRDPAELIVDVVAFRPICDIDVNPGGNKCYPVRPESLNRSEVRLVHLEASANNILTWLTDILSAVGGPVDVGA